ncbi:glycosyltransferase [Rhodobacteraceae bacterium KMM 6894]|nr:glycosyltransferase [Rhodobacteraceae bacterium KMM 6894]
MTHKLHLPLMTRFFHATRDDGLRTALRRARGFVARRIAGRSPGALSPAAPAPKGRHYLSGAWQMMAKNHAFHVTAAPATLHKRRKIALIGDLNLPQCRKYRVEQLVELWRTRDVDLTFAHYQDVPRCVAILQDATHLMCYRLPTCANVSVYLYEARRLRLPILYDIDDPLFSVAAYETYSNMEALPADMRAHFVAEAPRYLDLMNGADAVSVSTPGLAAHARQLTQRPVYLRRNFADRATLTAGAQAIQVATGNGDMFRVAFASGSQGHEVDFTAISDQVAAFLQGDSRRRLMILGHFDKARLPCAIAKQTEFSPFTGYSGYLQALALADCAIMPLGDDLFNQCKSAVRALDAAAVGVPVITPAVGDFPNVIRDGQTGLIADGPNGWAMALDDLAQDRAAAQAIGQRARRDLERHWSAQMSPHVIDPSLIDWVTA